MLILSQKMLIMVIYMIIKINNMARNADSKKNDNIILYSNFFEYDIIDRQPCI